MLPQSSFTSSVYCPSCFPASSVAGCLPRPSLPHPQPLLVGPWLAGWYTARVWTCVGNMEWGLPRGVGACQIFVLGEETEVCHLSLPACQNAASWTSLPPPIINCVQILGGAWIFLPQDRASMDPISCRSCAGNYSSWVQECTVMSCLETSIHHHPGPSPSLSMPSTMFSESWRA